MGLGGTIVCVQRGNTLSGAVCSAADARAGLTRPLHVLPSRLCRVVRSGVRMCRSSGWTVAIRTTTSFVQERVVGRRAQAEVNATGGALVRQGIAATAAPTGPAKGSVGGCGG